MDSNTANFLKEMDLLGGNYLAEAVHAEAMGYPVPFTTVEFLVVGKPLALHVPGPSLKATLQLTQPPTREHWERLQRRAWRMANDAFCKEPGHANMQFMRHFDPRDWGQYLDG